MDAITNKVELSGFAGADAEIKNLSGTLKLAKVQLAVNDSYKTSGGQEVKKTQWFTLTFWGAKAELAAEKVKKGTHLSIEGRLLNNFYEAKDGSKRYSIEIVVNEIYLKENETTNQTN
ncbi:MULTISPECIES: single-stranded DNA-binding protein [unclassified Pedobacter]|uniref:single-stranded DNA-binding protein n=1 Tax=unclassified Pedobacter TaxID=2628915 RepID=UPI001E3E9A9D|nr:MULTISPECIES: single-stranded DNA-binding protein [unclassified Pedobacter]